MLKNVMLPLMILALSFLSGCGMIGMGGADQMKKVTVMTTDPATLATITTVTEEPAPAQDGGGGGFFKSENLEEHYKFETARIANHESTAAKKVDAITTTTGKIMALEGPTHTEKLLTGIIANMQITAIQTSPGPSGVQAPKTMVDVADKNIGNLELLALGIWDRVDNDNDRGSSGDSSVNIENTGDGMVFYRSDKNWAATQATKYSLGDSTGEVSLGAPDTKPSFTNTDTDSHDITSTSNRTDSNDSSTLF